MELLKWLNDQLLRMDWLSALVGMLVQDVLGLDLASRGGASLHFFIYDTIKIFILLSALIFSISWIQSYFPPERTRRILSGITGPRANLMGALLGTLTPFCSCSSIPIFIGFTSSGLPLGVTFSFLISSPLVDLASIALLASVFNWTVAMVYALVGIALAVIGGTLISHARMEGQIEPFVMHNPVVDLPQTQLTPRDRLQFARQQVSDILHRVWFYVLLGVGIGALIHNWIPERMIATLLGEQNGWSVPLATLLAIPIYADIFSTLPIAEALVAKGVPLGTALAFMMSITATSLPSLIMLKKVIRAPLLALFVAIVLVGIIIIGYVLNAVSPLLL